MTKLVGKGNKKDCIIKEKFTNTIKFKYIKRKKLLYLVLNKEIHFLYLTTVMNLLNSTSTSKFIENIGKMM